MVVHTSNGPNAVLMTVQRENASIRMALARNAPSIHMYLPALNVRNACVQGDRYSIRKANAKSVARTLCLMLPGELV